jgi:hypothetical protein
VGTEVTELKQRCVPNNSTNAPVYDSLGVPISGTNFLASLYVGVAQDNLVEAKDFTSLTQPLRCPFIYTPNGRSGFFSSSYSLAYLPEILGGTLAWVQVRVWNTRLGQNLFAMSFLYERSCNLEFLRNNNVGTIIIYEYQDS